MAYDFLFASFEGGGNVPVLAAAIRRLRARGHSVRVLNDDAARADIDQAGAIFIPWTTPYNRPDRTRETDPLRDWETTEPGGGLICALDRLTIGPAAAYAADTLAELRRVPTDAVVGIDVLFGPMIAAQAAGVPLAILAANISLFTPIPGMPPAGPGLAPAVTEEDHAMQAGAGAWFADRVNERLPVLNAARAGVGLPPLTDGFDQTRSADRILLATSSAFDFPVPSLPRGMGYVGPLLDPPAWAQTWASPWPDDDRRPLILVAMSTTFQDQAATIQAVLDAAATLPARVLVTLGPSLSGESLRVPDNAAVLASAPHDAVMPDAAVVVTHCGHGTVIRALSHGRPMLCLPMGRDQNDNAARVAARGAGIRLDANADVTALRAGLSALLTEPGYAQAAATLGRAVAIAEPAHALVEALEALAAEGRRRAAA